MHPPHRSTLPARTEVRDSIEEIQFTRKLLVGGLVVGLCVTIAGFLSFLLVH